MSHWVSENKGGDFERVPCGMKHAVAVKIYDLGYQPGFKSGKPTHKYVILWELEDRFTKGDMVGQRFRVTKTYTASFGSANMPSNLRKDLESWRSRGFTTDELAKFDLDKIIGVNCTLNLVEKAKEDGRKYANIAGVMPPMKNEKIAVETPGDFVPDWVMELIDNMIPPDAAEQWKETTHIAAGAGVSDKEIPF